MTPWVKWLRGGWLLPAVLSVTAGAVDIIGFLALGDWRAVARLPLAALGPSPREPVVKPSFGLHCTLTWGVGRMAPCRTKRKANLSGHLSISLAVETDTQSNVQTNGKVN